MNTADRILFLLKTRGPQTAQQLADLLKLTSMGTRRQLEAWRGAGMIASDDRSEKVGRPARYWRLSEAGHARFPDRHSELTVHMIAAASPSRLALAGRPTVARFAARAS